MPPRDQAQPKRRPKLEKAKNELRFAFGKDK